MNANAISNNARKEATDPIELLYVQFSFSYLSMIEVRVSYIGEFENYVSGPH